MIHFQLQKTEFYKPLHPTQKQNHKLMPIITESDRNNQHIPCSKTTHLATQLLAIKSSNHQMGIALDTLG
jgi:hypothetical protein